MPTPEEKERGYRVLATMTKTTYDGRFPMEWDGEYRERLSDGWKYESWSGR